MSSTKKYIFNIITIFLCCCFVQSCSTKKSTFFTRAFHNTTTHYNWYFNGEEIVREIEEKLNNRHKNNYNQILSIYKLGTDKDAQNNTPALDKAIKKGGQAIKNHSILIKNQEHNKWVDDCYLMIGRAYFYKKDYLKAAEAFRYLSRNFEGLKSDFKAQIWLYKTYIEQNDFSSAEIMLSQMLSDEEFPVKLNKDLALANAHYYLKKENYTDAKQELLTAIELTKKKSQDRYCFILAQIYQLEKNYSKATEYYEEVIKKSGNYELVFNAKINRARSYDVGSGNIEKIRKELNKMLEDNKNKDYQDVIYYGLAELAIREKKTEEAIPLYKLSVSKSIKNDHQKATSSLSLAELLYDQEKYRPAQAYYDTVVAYSTSKHPKYKSALNKQKTLSELIYNLDLIIYEDSILKISNLPEQERNDFIDNIIKTLEREELLAKQEELNNKSESRFFNNNQTSSNRFNQSQQTQGGMWYFYNSTTLSFGYSEFSRKWGKRKLEDDWRRRDKISITNEDLSEDTIQEQIFDPKDKASYLENLFLTEEAKIRSKKRVVTAYHNAGSIYKEKLKDLERAIQMFEEVNQKFPKNKNKNTSYYQLYVIYKEKSDNKNSAKYRRLLLNEFPNSEYSRIIENPKLINELVSEKTKIQALYTKAYEKYLTKEYNQSIKICEQAMRADTLNTIKPHFSLLSAVCTGFLYGEARLKQDLKIVQKTYEGHVVSESAKEILRNLNKVVGETKKPLNPTPSLDNEEEKVSYTHKNNTPHYFIILFKDFDVNINTAKETFSNYHSEYYGLEKLNISSLLLDEQTHMISIREFKNNLISMDYYNAFMNSEVRGPFGTDFEAFIISAENFPVFFKNKDIDGYKQEFQKMYLRQ